MKFEWDAKKERQNIQKHKISFSDACYIFADKFSLTLFDNDHSADEERWITLGQLQNGKIFVVNHTFREINGEEYVRIISARKAANKEIKQYLKRKG